MLSRMPPGDARDALLTVLALSILSACGGAPGRPGVLLISIDSLRRDHVTPYGVPSKRAPGVATTPALEALAAEGVLFEDAVSTTTWTLPSHAALLTGLPDALHGLTHPDRRLDPALTTLPELLRDEGYATAAFISGPNLHPAFGFFQGFETYVNCGNFEAGLELFQTDRPGRFQDVHADSHRGLTSDGILAESSEWITAAVRDRSRPFFAFVHWWDPHYDYTPPPAYSRLFDPDYRGGMSGENFLEVRSYSARDLDHLLALYDAEIRYTDERIGTLLATLDAAGVGDDTIVALVSDHGDEFFDHGKKGHQREFWEEVVRVPMMLRWRGGPVPAGVRAGGQAGIQDLYATIADLLDVAAPAYIEARSLRTLWEQPGSPGAAQPLHLELPDKGVHLSGLRTAEGKVWWDRSAGQGILFDLATDPGEESPVIFGDLETSTHPLVAALRASLADLDRRLPGVPRTVGQEVEPLPATVRTALEDLGYTPGSDGSDP